MKSILILILSIFTCVAFAQVKISDMPAASTLSGTELFPIVQSGVNKKSTLNLIQSNISIAWNKITSKPTTLGGYGITDAQVTLVSGTNIKTINGLSLLESGDLSLPNPVTGSALTWDTDRYNLGGNATDNVLINFSGFDYELTGASNYIFSGSDNTARAIFDFSSIATSTDQYYSWPDQSGTVALTSDIPPYAPTGSKGIFIDSFTKDIQLDITMSNNALVKMDAFAGVNGKLVASMFSDNGTQSYATNLFIQTTGGGAGAGLTLLNPTTDPTGLGNAQIWYNGSTHLFKGRANAVTYQFITDAQTQTMTNKTHSTGSTWNGNAITNSYGGVPSGGSTGQYLVKNSATNYDYSWGSAPGWALTGTSTLTGNAIISGATRDVDFNFQSLDINTSALVALATSGGGSVIMNTSQSSLVANTYNGFYADATHVAILAASGVSVERLSITQAGLMKFVVTKLNVTGLPTSSAGLSSGDVWLNSNVWTVVP